MLAVLQFLAYHLVACLPAFHHPSRSLSRCGCDVELHVKKCHRQRCCKQKAPRRFPRDFAESVRRARCSYDGLLFIYLVVVSSRNGPWPIRVYAFCAISSSAPPSSALRRK